MSTQTDPWGIAIEWHDYDPDAALRPTLFTYRSREALDEAYGDVAGQVAGKADLVIIKRTADGGWERAVAA